MSTWAETWVGTTWERFDNWMVTIHWHHYDNEVFPAGVDVRSYGLPDDNYPSQPYPDPQHHLGRSSAVRPVTGELMRKRIPWGDTISRQRQILTEDLDESLRHLDDPSWHEIADLAGSRGAVGRADDDIYRLVGRLYAQADKEGRRDVGVRVLELLQEHGFPFRDEGPDHPDRVRVRRWIGIAKKKGYVHLHVPHKEKRNHAERTTD